MIQLTCTNCRAVLQMDDAFAGGVCRCRHCGTIQTVPKPSRRQSSPGESAPASTDTGQSKTLFQRPSGFGADLPGSGTGLDELANVVASSGLSGGLGTGRLRQSSPDVPAPGRPAAARPPAADPKNRKALIAAAIVGAMLVSASITWWAVREGNGGVGDSAMNVDERDSGRPTPQATGRPAFMGLPLDGKTIALVLDRGQGTRSTFDYTRLAAVNSLRSLGADQRFQVLLWQVDTSDGEVVAYPVNGPIAPTPEHVAAAKRVIEDVAAYGQSKLGPALQKALAGNPEEVIIATGKYGLEPEVVAEAMKIRGSSDVRFHTFSLGEAGSPEVLKELAEKTGGQFREIPTAELRSFAE